MPAASADDLPALTLSADPIWARVPAGVKKLSVVVSLGASDLPLERRRPSLSLALVLDTSGSMAGPPLEQVVRSVEKILDLLHEEDEVAIVAFSTRAYLVSKRSKLDPGTKRAIAARVSRLFADDRTNIEAGLALGLEELPAEAAEGGRSVIVLLTDGEPNEGATTPELLGTLARNARRRASVSTLGYGIRHDERILLALAEGGGGSYKFVSDPGTCQLELTQAIGAQGDIAIEGIDLVLVPEPGVQIEGVRGAGTPRFSSDGMHVTVPDLPARSTRPLVVDLGVSLDEKKMLGKLLEVRARYRRAGSSEPIETSAIAHVDIGGTEPTPNAEPYAAALLVRADAVRADARNLADRGQFDGAAAVLRALMDEIEKAPGYATGDGSALSEAWEQLLDEAVAMERRPHREALAALKASSATRSLSTTDGVRASSRPLGRTAMRFTKNLSGAPTAPAFLIVSKGPNVGVRHKLGLQNTLGRTTSADIHLKSGQVSRRHADIFILEGDYFVADLGSTNVTAVNGRRLDRAPHLLKSGDRILVGDIELVFER